VFLRDTEEDGSRAEPKKTRVKGHGLKREDHKFSRQEFARKKQQAIKKNCLPRSSAPQGKMGGGTKK